MSESNNYFSKAEIDEFCSIIKSNEAPNWYVYAFKEFFSRQHACLPFKWIVDNVEKNTSILASGCGAGDMLYHLYKMGFRNLSGYDLYSNIIRVAKEFSKYLNSDIVLFGR
ncbi:hypothetical protein SAMN02910357_02505 [Succinivibrio dextrinosolvens]|uniref:hypothetical protein n=1 Tax=Succinivibrio dextrinosolvens TaxID=83771 RepID=UPI0008ED9467|nr:hypothetical protein [Succinivibrio dextrinosolvens]SFS90648.1 hypothetical protein SAMN02910357_02505 [Succinivibrio dextrinosolvens]